MKTLGMFAPLIAMGVVMAAYAVDGNFQRTVVLLLCVVVLALTSILLEVAGLREGGE